MSRPTTSQTTISAVINLMGSDRRAGLAMGVSTRSVIRYRKGEQPLIGSALASARAVIRHPDDFVEIRRTVAIKPRKARK